MAKACVVANLFRKGSSCSGASSFSTRTPAATVPAADASMRACTSEDSLECVALAEVQDGAQFLLRCQLVGESLVPFLRLECPQVRKVLEVRLSLHFFTETFAFLRGSRQVYFVDLKWRASRPCSVVLKIALIRRLLSRKKRGFSGVPPEVIAASSTLRTSALYSNFILLFDSVFLCFVKVCRLASTNF